MVTMAGGAFRYIGHVPAIYDDVRVGDKKYVWVPLILSFIVLIVGAYWVNWYIIAFSLLLVIWNVMVYYYGPKSKKKKR